MKDIAKQQVVIQRLIQWAEEQELVRGMLLFSSRANPDAPVDIFSDYDVLLLVSDVHRFYREDHWLDDFGKVLVVFRNPIGVENGFERSGFITHYEDGVKVDFCFYPVEYLSWAAQGPRLPDDLDNGYTVLLDKDNLTQGIKPPTYKAYFPCPPTEQEYLARIEEFFNDSIYVAKHLWRDNLLTMETILNYDVKSRDLRIMLEWQMEGQHNWQVKPGAHGKGLKKYIDPEIWSELESTYVGAGIEENWKALFRTMALFRKVAVNVAGQLGYKYPYDLEERVLSYMQKIRNTDKQASSFDGLICDR